MRTILTVAVTLTLFGIRPATAANPNESQIKALKDEIPRLKGQEKRRP